MIGDELTDNNNNIQSLAMRWAHDNVLSSLDKSMPLDRKNHSAA